MSKNRKRVNGNGLDRDEHLTAEQACAYAAEYGVEITPNALALQRRDCKGPKYIKINGRWIRYTPRFLDPYIEARKPQLVDPDVERRRR